MFAVLNLGDGRKFACEDLDSAIEAWLDNFSESVEATIEIYPQLGVAGLVSTYRFDEENEAWIKTN